MSLLERFLAVAQQQTDRLAFIQGDRQVSYGELATGVHAVAGALATKICPSDTVGLLMDNCPEYAIASYAIWKAGATVVGFNAALKSDDLQALFEHSRIACLIVSARFYGANEPFVSELDVPVLIIEELIAEGGSSERQLESPNADALAAIIYTSGTTGNPKGVMLSHKNLSENIAAIQMYLPACANDRVLCILPFFYSYGNSLLHCYLSLGGCIVLENSMMYPKKILESIHKHKITVFSGVPSSFYLLLKRADLDRADLSSLRYCTQAGGAMEPQRLQDWCSKVAADFFVMYGQTEATARICYLPPEKLTEKLGSVGIPIPGVELKIINADGLECMAGERGEVCVSGANVMLGYLRDEKETANTIREGWLHTGDLGYLDEDGFLYLVGRRKEMIKSGAHRIHPREIEEKILNVEGVEEVSVSGMPDDLLGEVVKASVVADSDDDCLRRNILSYCRQSLAAYKIPKEIVFLTELPKTASGKVKKHLL